MDTNVIQAAQRLGDRSLQASAKELNLMRLTDPFDADNKVHSFYMRNTELDPELSTTSALNNLKIR